MPQLCECYTVQWHSTGFENHVFISQMHTLPPLYIINCLIKPSACFDVCMVS